MADHTYLNLVILVMIIIGVAGLVLKYAPGNESKLTGQAIISDIFQPGDEVSYKSPVDGTTIVTRIVRINYRGYLILADGRTMEPRKVDLVRAVEDIPTEISVETPEPTESPDAELELPLPVDPLELVELPPVTPPGAIELSITTLPHIGDQAPTVTVTTSTNVGDTVYYIDTNGNLQSGKVVDSIPVPGSNTVGIRIQPDSGGLPVAISAEKVLTLADLRNTYGSYVFLDYNQLLVAAAEVGGSTGLTTYTGADGNTYVVDGKENKYKIVEVGDQKILVPLTEAEKKACDEAVKKYNKELQEALKQQRKNRRTDALTFWNNIFHAHPGAQYALGMLNAYLMNKSGDDLTWHGMTDVENWITAATGNWLSGYHASMWFCNVTMRNPSAFFINTVPTSGDVAGLPSQGSLLSVYAERIDYSETSSASCTFLEDSTSISPKWFFKVSDSGKSYLGYLYKVSWFVNYPYSESELENINYGEKGLESDGSIIFTIELRSIANNGQCGFGKQEGNTYKIVNGIGVIKPGDKKGLMNLSIEADYLQDALTRYEKDYITKVCIVFDKWEYDGSNTELCNDVKSTSLSVPADFIFTPSSDSCSIDHCDLCLTQETCTAYNECTWSSGSCITDTAYTPTPGGEDTPCEGWC